MLRALVVAAIAIVALAAVPAPSGTEAGGCGLALTTDAAVKRLDRTQSIGAAKICAIYLNTLDTAFAR